MDNLLNANGVSLRNQLVLARSEENWGGKIAGSDKLINVAGVGTIVSTTFEQLRNAAEYAQEHLLMQKAIRRFFVRNLSFQIQASVKKVIAEELISELTQSGYVRNNTQPVKSIDELLDLITEHYDNYWRLKKSGVDVGRAQAWTLDLLSVGSERIIVTEKLLPVFVQFVYRHYQETFQKDFFCSSELDELDYEVSLYISIYRSLLRSDIATVRYGMQKLYAASDAKIDEYANFHKRIDTIFNSILTNKITNYINKYGAPLRVLKSFILENGNASTLLASQELFNAAYADQIDSDYRKSKAKLNRGLIKSILFLLITKTIIGIAIEIPYDIFATGIVMVLPLIINLFTPVAYMALLRLGIHLPDKANTRAIKLYMDNALFSEPDESYQIRSRISKKSYPIGFRIAYALMFMLVFGFVINVLYNLDFNFVQIAIFFIFFGSASFLGFRLTGIVQELELVTERPSIITSIRDFLFLPFTILGKWLSDKYQKFNIVAVILDTIIELPLKTVLRLIRQWGGFIDAKKDDI
jgi:hypothetical protein